MNAEDWIERDWLSPDQNCRNLFVRRVEVCLFHPDTQEHSSDVGRQRERGGAGVGQVVTRFRVARAANALSNARASVVVGGIRGT
eukprot:1883057-Rhodomonas_salina.2